MSTPVLFLPVLHLCPSVLPHSHFPRHHCQFPSTHPPSDSPTCPSHLTLTSTCPPCPHCQCCVCLCFPAIWTWTSTTHEPKPEHVLVTVPLTCHLNLNLCPVPCYLNLMLDLQTEPFTCICTCLHARTFSLPLTLCAYETLSFGCGLFVSQMFHRYEIGRKGLRFLVPVLEHWSRKSMSWSWFDVLVFFTHYLYN